MTRVAVLLVLAIFSYQTPIGRAAAQPGVTAISSLHRVGPKDLVQASPDVHLWAARGECESFQIVIHAASGAPLQVTDVKVAPFANGELALPAVQLYREHFVTVARASPDWRGSNRSLGAGTYPDALIPFLDVATDARVELRAIPFSVPAGQNQIIWADVCVPPGVPDGNYHSTYKVTTTSGELSGVAALTVWNFELPRRPSLKSSFLVWQYNNVFAQEELLRNRLQPLGVSENQRRFIEEFGLRYTNLGIWSGADFGRCTMRPAPTRSEIEARKRLFDPELTLYNFTADEVDACTNLIPAIREWGRNLHEAGVKNLMTIKPTPELYDDGTGSGRSAVDIWVLLPKMYDASRSRVLEVLAKGDEVWSSNTLVQDSYSPKWLLDYSPMNFRVQPGFMSHALGMNGLLYWRVDGWHGDPWNDVSNAGVFGNGSFPGEGILIYPGNKLGIEGVAPSMRLKWLRDGAEDYEYLELLKKAGHAAEASTIGARVASSWAQWTREPETLQEARRAMGELLHRIYTEQPKPADSATDERIN